MGGLFSMLRRIDEERARLRADEALSAAGVTAELLTTLGETEATIQRIIGNLARTRLLEARASLKAFSDQVEIIRFEIAKAEKELAETGVDPLENLERQILRRPAMPSEAWNYWKFEGEFWRDEIGYYQFTLKRRCPAAH